MAWAGKPATLSTNKTNGTLRLNDHPAHHNAMAAAINAIVTLLGNDPAADSATLTERISDIIDDITTLQEAGGSNNVIISGVVVDRPVTTLGTFLADNGVDFLPAGTPVRLAAQVDITQRAVPYRVKSDGTGFEVDPDGSTLSSDQLGWPITFGVVITATADSRAILFGGEVRTISTDGSHFFVGPSGVNSAVYLAITEVATLASDASTDAATALANAATAVAGVGQLIQAKRFVAVDAVDGSASDLVLIVEGPGTGDDPPVPAGWIRGGGGDLGSDVDAVLPVSALNGQYVIKPEDLGSPNHKLYIVHSSGAWTDVGATDPHAALIMVESGISWGGYPSLWFMRPDGTVHPIAMTANVTAMADTGYPYPDGMLNEEGHGPGDLNEFAHYLISWLLNEVIPNLIGAVTSSDYLIGPRSITSADTVSDGDIVVELDATAGAFDVTLDISIGKAVTINRLSSDVSGNTVHIIGTIGTETDPTIDAGESMTIYRGTEYTTI